MGVDHPHPPVLLVLKKASPDVPKAVRRVTVEIPVEEAGKRTTVEAATNKGNPIPRILTIAIICVSR